MSRVIAGTRRHTRRHGGEHGRHRVGLAFVTVGLVVALLSGGGGAEADLASLHYVTVAPGQTLWDIAVAQAPPGSDPRSYLLRLREANGLDARHVPAWTVVILPHPDLPADHLAPRLWRRVLSE